MEIYGDPQIRFTSNLVTTSKYTIWNFFIKYLYEQFQKYSNIYFLFISILQCLPEVTTTNSVPTFAVPLSFVLILNAAKDAYEDWRRHKSDGIENHNLTHTIPPFWTMSQIVRRSPSMQGHQEEEEQEQGREGQPKQPGTASSFSGSAMPNESEVEIVRHRTLDSSGSNSSNSGSNIGTGADKDADEEEQTNDSIEEAEEDDYTLIGLNRLYWKELKVGDIVVCRNREVFPADLLIICSSDANGVAFVETASLDGETNLKVKQARKETIEVVGSSVPVSFEAIGWASGSVTCGQPDKDLNFFNGHLKLTAIANQEVNMDISVSAQQLLLRGCKLRNTDWVAGIVIYTGHDTKILRNSTVTPRKTSRVERLTNRLTYFIWAVQAVFCLIGAIATGLIANSKSFQNRSYLGLKSDVNAARAGFMSFWTWLVLSANFVPISLIVTMGMVKALQGYFILMDEDMYHEASDTYACPRTSDLNEELGQVEYVFSDKTGTLTCNVMEFRKCAVNAVSYGMGLTEIRRQVLRKSGQPVPDEPVPSPDAPVTPNVNFVDPKLSCHMLDTSHPNHNDLVEFFVHLGTNHSVLPEVAENGLSRYSASSPDEGALVYGAKHFGVEFVGRDPSGVCLSLRGRPLQIDILANIEFSSQRKRSSVICRIPTFDNRGSRITLFCKGADNVISARLANFGKREAKLFEQMEEYAVDGLRTLCIAKRELSTNEFLAWYQQYEQAILRTEGRQEQVDSLAESIEKDMILQGVTGIEDTLQEGVGTTIEALRHAGVKVWMLTGDKVETAINIGIATSLITVSCLQLVYSLDALDTVEELTERLKADSELYGGDRRKRRSKKSILRKSDRQLTVIVDGQALDHFLKKDMAHYFVNLCRNCQSVICCRVTPHQKGAVVTLIKKTQRKITLAIGDGANDCNMIQCAHVGVGLRGQEGLQAFNTSDYGLSQFRFLQNLLLIHGRWCYRRITKLVLYMFYKNIVLVMPVFYFAFLSLFSGQKIYFEYLYQLYNVIYTLLPIVVFGVLEQDVGKKTSLKYPALYRLGHIDYYFNNIEFAKWIFNGLWHAVVLFSVPLYTLSYLTVPTLDGKPLDKWMVGTVIFLLITIVVNLKVVLETSYMTWLTWLAVLFSVLGFLLFAWLFSHLPPLAGALLGSTTYIFSSPAFWICIVLTVVLTLLRDYVWKTFQRSFMPELHHLIQDEEILGLDVPELRLARQKVAELEAATSDAGKPEKVPTKTLKVSAHKVTDEKRIGETRRSSRGYAFTEADYAATRLLRSESATPTHSLLGVSEIGNNIKNQNKTNMNLRLRMVDSQRESILPSSSF